MIETRQILEELELKNVLATSPTGAVFLAGDPATGRDVVIKMVSCGVPGAEEVIRRLFLEMAQAARSVEIEGMPTLRDHGLTPEGDGFLVMDVVDGEPLDTEDELSAFAAINVLLDVLSCVEGLARAGTAHLNLTPSNVLVTNPPAYDRAVVVGFGTSATLLHAGNGVPVPAHDPHLAPELVSGDLLPPTESWRSDLFSFGVIACSALGAEIEADGSGRPVVTIPEPIRSTLPEAEPLEAILGQIMDPNPARRGSSPTEVRDPLIRALPDPPAMAAPPSAPGTAGGFDPNKTDPSFDPAATIAIGARAPRFDESPDDEPTRPSAFAARNGGPEPVPEAINPEDGDGWPEVLFDDPVLPASLGGPEDTDVRNPIPDDVWVPADGEGIGGGPPEAAAPASRGTGGGRRVSRLELAVVSAVVIVLGSILAITWSISGSDHEPAVPVAVQVPDSRPAEALVPPPPDDNLFDDLVAVQQLVDAGELDAARAALERLDGREELAFSSDEAALYDSLVSAISMAADRGEAIDSLRAGLANGSVKMVRRGVAGVSRLPAHEIALVDGLAPDLERARRILVLHSEMWGAHGAGDFAGAIDAARRLEAAFPGYGGAPDIRRQSAVALETRAESLIAEQRFGEAVAVLEDLQRAWPEREGVAPRIAWCRDRIERTRRGESAIAAALAEGESGDPEAGLAVLDGLAPDPGLADEVERARAVLRSRLAEMDAAAPVVELVGEVELGFKKNQTLTVPLRVVDDYRVERVVVFARNESDDDFLQIPLQPDSEGRCQFTVSPELHGNKNVYFYVVARDRSGHVGYLASPDEPQLVVRKKWFKKLL